MNAATTPKPSPTLLALRRALPASTAINALAIGARMVEQATASTNRSAKHEQTAKVA